MAVNLCGESSTVGALYGGLAGIWYGGDEGKDDKLFWTKRVREWKKVLQRQDLVEETSKKMAQIAIDRSNC